MRPTQPTRHRPAVPADSLQLFTRADALAADWSDSALHEAISSGRLRRVHEGVYSYPDDVVRVGPEARRDDLLFHARAIQRAAPRAVISHAAAAVAVGLPTICRLDRPCLTVQSRSAVREYLDAHLHRASLGPSDRITIDDVDVTQPPRTVLDMAREFGADAGIAAADAALRLKLATLGELQHVRDQCRRWPGARTARLVVALADPDGESPLESISRLRMWQSGLPMPKLQVRLGDEHGRFIRRVDSYWPEYGVAGEADGAGKYDDVDETEGRRRVSAEKRQQEDLEELGVVFVRWGWPDLRRFDAVTARLRRAFVRGIPLGPAQRWSVLPPRCT